MFYQHQRVPMIYQIRYKYDDIVFKSAVSTVGTLLKKIPRELSKYSRYWYSINGMDTILRVLGVFSYDHLEDRLQHLITSLKMGTYNVEYVYLLICFCCVSVKTVLSKQLSFVSLTTNGYVTIRVCIFTAHSHVRYVVSMRVYWNTNVQINSVQLFLLLLWHWVLVWNFNVHNTKFNDLNIIVPAFLAIACTRWRNENMDILIRAKII